MSRGPLEEQGLREAFTSLAEIAGDGSRCPTSDRIWASAREELSGGDDEEVILHLSECTACATAWRLARELSLPQGGNASVTTRAWRPLLSRRLVPLLAAAVLVVGVAGLLIGRLPRQAPEEPAYRSGERRWLESRVPGGTPLSRETFVLRWAPGPAGTTYDLHLTSEKLEPLAQASGLREAEHEVEGQKLAAVASGERVLWRVVAHMPDGRTLSSRTFSTTIE